MQSHALFWSVKTKGGLFVSLLLSLILADTMTDDEFDVKKLYFRKKLLHDLIATRHASVRSSYSESARKVTESVKT